MSNDMDRAGAHGDPGSVLCAMSGGVDSSVAASLLVDEGFDVTGMTMLLFGYSVLGEGMESGCCSLDDVEDAKQACRMLGIPHYTFNFKSRFAHDVIDRFCADYLNGRTPNPCIDCNRYLKFSALQQRRRELGIDYVATGHYARREMDPETSKWRLLRAADRNKDQSYVLYHLTQDDLAHMLFPLGSLKKPEVRSIASRLGFSNAGKAESQDICFVPDGDYASFIQRYALDGGGAPGGKADDPTATGCVDPQMAELAFSEGDIVDADGNVLGRHGGFARYTIGQRKGLGIASPEPLYVQGKDASRNIIVASTRDGLLTDMVRIDDVNIISGDEAVPETEVSVKLSYRQDPVPATFSTTSPSEAVIHLHEPQVRPASGQSVVAYIGDEVLGGGKVSDSCRG